MDRFLRWVRTAAWLPAALLIAAGSSTARADDGAAALRAYWPLDERSGQSVPDASGNANHGQLGSSPVTDAADPNWVDGWLGGGLRFDGDDDYIQVPDSPSLETPPTLTVSAYFRGNGSPGLWRYLVSKGSRRCREASYGLYSAFNGGLGFYIASRDGFVISPQAGQDVWDGRWHHATGTFDGATLRLFVDGEEVGNGTPTGVDIEYGLPGQTAYLGAYRGDCDLMLKGDLDDVAIWGRALGAPEIRAIARDGPVAVAPAPALGVAVGHPTARCKKRKGSRRRCRMTVTFLVHRRARVRIDVARLRGRKARKLGSLSMNVRPPRVTVQLPRRLGGEAIGPGRYRVTLLGLDRGRYRRLGSTTGRVR
jgi:hypothetical protein